MAQGPARQQSNSSRPPPRQNRTPVHAVAVPTLVAVGRQRSRRPARSTAAAGMLVAQPPGLSAVARRLAAVHRGHGAHRPAAVARRPSHRASFLPLRRCSQKRGRAGRLSEQWSCAVCTLVNSGSSRACEACSSTRPVEVVNAAADDDLDLDLGVLASASFLPL
ncbi:hypothetical protein E2562_026456 [Oryza meyeriana var. granulata]|uniref:RanBP2-type domain-containing protein n=1 Tax=Oryza meyeriana var. granulata TaxID=110450 RepID=A0A6G1DNM3_9ORYZ|nr:hypothetical protein E2562_026456 [Oryza meyeriana var. granulata]